MAGGAEESGHLLSNSRLDWLDSFNRTLHTRVEDVIEHPDEPAVLILAWAHLRTLVEGHFKLLMRPSGSSAIWKLRLRCTVIGKRGRSPIRRLHSLSCLALLGMAGRHQSMSSFALALHPGRGRPFLNAWPRSRHVQRLPASSSVRELS